MEKEPERTGFASKKRPTQLILATVTLALMITGIALGGYEYNLNESKAKCLSCLGLNPVIDLEFVIKTANGQDHPKWVIEPLRDKAVFVEYTQSKGCAACDKMDPIVDELHEEYGGRMEFIIIDTLVDFTRGSTYDIYDINNIGGYPTFVILTLDDDGGEVKPFFGQTGGVISRGELEDAINYAIDVHQQYKHNFNG